MLTNILFDRLIHVNQVYYINVKLEILPLVQT